MKKNKSCLILNSLDDVFNYIDDKRVIASFDFSAENIAISVSKTKRNIISCLLTIKIPVILFNHKITDISQSNNNEVFNNVPDELFINRAYAWIINNYIWDNSLSKFIRTKNNCTWDNSSFKSSFKL